MLWSSEILLNVFGSKCNVYQFTLFEIEISKPKGFFNSKEDVFLIGSILIYVRSPSAAWAPVCEKVFPSSGNKTKKLIDLYC